jgi:hypothetical protein
MLSSEKRIRNVTRRRWSRLTFAANLAARLRPHQSADAVRVQEILI